MSAPEHPNDWARFLAELIARPGWTQQRLADAAGVDRSTVRRWRNGEVVNVTSQSIKLIATAAGVPEEVAAAAAVSARRQIEGDEAVREVEESDLPDVLKIEIIDYIRAQRDKAEADLRQAVGMMMRSHRAAS